MTADSKDVTERKFLEGFRKAGQMLNIMKQLARDEKEEVCDTENLAGGRIKVKT